MIQTLMGVNCMQKKNVRDSDQFDYAKLIVEGDVHFFHTIIFSSWGSSFVEVEFFSDV